MFDAAPAWLRLEGSVPRGRTTWSAISRTVPPTLPSFTKKSPATNGALKFSMTTPSFSTSVFSTSSGTFRGWLQTALVLECEKMTGASEILMALRIVSAWTWAMSTAIPTRFISLTTISPNFDSPPAVACSLYLPPSSSAASAQPGPPLCVSVMYRTPRRWYMRSVASDPLI